MASHREFSLTHRALRAAVLKRPLRYPAGPAGPALARSRGKGHVESVLGIGHSNGRLQRSDTKAGRELRPSRERTVRLGVTAPL
jgi:hypothetical protein